MKLCSLTHPGHPAQPPDSRAAVGHQADAAARARMRRRTPAHRRWMPARTAALPPRESESRRPACRPSILASTVTGTGEAVRAGSFIAILSCLLRGAGRTMVGGGAWRRGPAPRASAARLHTEARVRASPRNAPPSEALKWVPRASCASRLRQCLTSPRDQQGNHHDESRRGGRRMRPRQVQQPGILQERSAGTATAGNGRRRPAPARRRRRRRRRRPTPPRTRRGPSGPPPLLTPKPQLAYGRALDWSEGR